MKKWPYILVVGLIFTVPTVVQAIDKIAVVNVASIFQNSPQRALVAKQLENEFKVRAANLQSMERKLQIKIQRLQREGSSMKSSERSLLEKDVMEQKEIFSSKAQEFEQDNQNRQTEERNKILNTIQEAVKKVAIKEGYNIVIDANSVAYFANSKDITADVWQRVK